ncbi:MAG: imidazolonepropionase [Acidimicrobiia bacterium]|nr:imidazolonepropionase [Acidimicrobiia bacterium]MDH4306132.1 imidazolonepropionase [Acidimicrobiia bacterium]MDH5292127.1 imidazolonepropionase [Acidimicrobiia bacterium]
MAASTVIDNIGALVTNDPERESGRLGRIDRAALVIEDGTVVHIAPAGTIRADRRLDVGGRAVLPGFVDSHTHLVFAGDRSAEFAARMAGAPYAAGGIRVTTDATRNASEDALREALNRRVAEARQAGITTLEIKSGYGLTTEDETRILRLAREATTETTFLGAHVVPTEYSNRPDDYVDLVAGPMMDACAPHARFVDVFCEEGAFDEDQSRRVLKAGIEHGLRVKVHGNQLGFGPGVGLAVEMGATSVDHCTHLTGSDIESLAGSSVVATFLPLADFSTRQPYPDARKVVDAGVTVAVATNCNPGSSYSTSMSLCIALAVRDMHMTIDEAVWAATAGGAAALGRSDVGRLTPGGPADLVVLDAPSHDHLVYRPGVPLIHSTYVGGRLVHSISPGR